MSSLVLMENAGRGCTDVLCQLGVHGLVTICCGRGNNGGDGLVLARHLDLRGAAVRVIVVGSPTKSTSDFLANLEILGHADVPILAYDDVDAGERCVAALDAEPLSRSEWLVDGLLGTGSRGAPRPPLDMVIRAMNAHRGRKLAIDLPSGLDCDSGEPADPTFRADHTVTFVAPKTGFLNAAAQPFLGVVHVTDIGAPRRLVASLTQGAPKSQ